MMSVLGILLLTTVFMQETVGDPLLDVTPPELVFGLTSSLEVNCSFSIDTTSSLAAIVSLIILKSNDSGQTFTEIATINSFSPYKVNLLTKDENVTTGGYLNDAGDSFLLLSWQNPMEDQEGMFRCSAHGFDRIGHTKVVTATAEVHGRKTNSGDYAGIVKQMSLSMGETLSAFQNYTLDHRALDPEIVEYYTSALDQSLRNLDAYLKRLEQRIAEEKNDTEALEESVLQMENDCLNRLDYCLNTIDDAGKEYLCTIFEKLVLIHKGTKYYISDRTPASGNAAMSVCNMLGGHFLEINDLEEYHIIQKFLNATKAPGAVYAMIAGSDADTEDRWLFQTSGQPVPILDWAPGEPDGDHTENCLFLSAKKDWRMIEDVCVFHPYVDSVRFLCEVPMD